jgi:Arc/MetJ-type ribon-helix-helix transcriptional regulator
MNINLDPQQEAFARHQAEAEGYDSIDAYVAALVERARRYHARQQMDARLEQALDSGQATPMQRADWDAIRQRGERRMSGET